MQKKIETAKLGRKIGRPPKVKVDDSNKKEDKKSIDESTNQVLTGNSINFIDSDCGCTFHATGNTVLANGVIIDNNIIDKYSKKEEIISINEPKLSDLQLSDLKILKETAIDAIEINKYPDGDRTIIQECTKLIIKINDELYKRLRLY
jgi:hypothetical protein